MAIQAVAGGTQCGAKRHATEFTGTGPAKGNYVVSICDRPKHNNGRHVDSVTGEKWSD